MVRAGRPHHNPGVCVPKKKGCYFRGNELKHLKQIKDLANFNAQNELVFECKRTQNEPKTNSKDTQNELIFTLLGTSFGTMQRGTAWLQPRPSDAPGDRLAWVRIASQPPKQRGETDETRMLSAFFIAPVQ